MGAEEHCSLHPINTITIPLTSLIARLLPFAIGTRNCICAPCVRVPVCAVRECKFNRFVRVLVRACLPACHVGASRRLIVAVGEILTILCVLRTRPTCHVLTMLVC